LRLKEKYRCNIGNGGNCIVKDGIGIVIFGDVNGGSGIIGINKN
jgi:hypothetical protein